MGIIKEEVEARGINLRC